MLESLLKKVAGLRPAILLKRDSNTGVLAKFLRTPFSTEHLRWLLLAAASIVDNNNYFLIYFLQ